MSSFEEEHLEVLHNIEASIVAVYRDQPSLADYQVDSAIEALGRTYLGETRGKAPVLPKNPLAQEVYQAVKAVCEWQMGRENMVDEEGQPFPSTEAITREEVLACLKRIRKSVSLWTKEGGSQGYLKYITQFLPG